MCVKFWICHVVFMHEMELSEVIVGILDLDVKIEQMFKYPKCASDNALRG